MMKKLSLKSLDLKGKKVLMRVDFNVPLDKSGHVTDDTRILSSLPSIRYVLEQGASLILMSHLGRPEGKKDSTLSLKPCAERLSKLLGRKVIMASDCIGKDVTDLTKKLKAGDVVLLENLRFHPGEEDPENHPEFVKALSELGNCYVNDAFSSAHRNHASTAAICKWFDGVSAEGFLLSKEVCVLKDLLQNPSRPFHCIIGGAKISTKIGAIKALLGKIDKLYIGGAMAYTFLKALGKNVGNSVVEEKHLSLALELLKDAEKRKITVVLPSDLVVVKDILDPSQSKICKVETGVPEGWEGVDIGPETITLFSKNIAEAKTILWNGPLGVYEVPEFALGTCSIAKAIAKNREATSVVGGGDSIASIHASGVQDQITHLSTGGGAMLEFLEFGTLPGVEALTDVF